MVRRPFRSRVYSAYEADHACSGRFALLATGRAMRRSQHTSQLLLFDLALKRGMHDVLKRLDVCGDIGARGVAHLMLEIGQDRPRIEFRQESDVSLRQIAARQDEADIRRHRGDVQAVQVGL